MLQHELSDACGDSGVGNNRFDFSLDIFDNGIFKNVLDWLKVLALGLAIFSMITIGLFQCNCSYFLSIWMLKA